METSAALAVALMIGSMVGVLHFKIDSPTMVFVLINAVIAFGGYYLPFDSDLFALLGRTGANVYDAVFIDCCGFILGFCAGAVLMHMWTRAPVEDEQQRNLFKNSQTLGAIPVLGFVSVAVYIIGTGPMDLLNRQVYMTQNIGALKVIGGIFSLLCCLAMGVSAKAGDSRVSISSYIVVVMVLLTFVGYSSRSSAFGLVLFFLGQYYVTRRGVEAVLLILAMACAPILVHISLFMRSAPRQGLVPLFDEINNGKLFLDFSYKAAIDNFLFVNFYITSLTAAIAQVNLHHMLVSLNPLPGTWVGWDRESTGIHPFIPYTSFGEWIAFSPAAGIVFYVLLGALFEWFDYKRRSGDFIYTFLAPVFLICFTVISLQYSTRSSIRLLYYLCGIIMISLVSKSLYRTFKKTMV